MDKLTIIEELHVFYATYDTAMEHYRQTRLTENKDLARSSFRIGHTLHSAVNKMGEALEQPAYYADALAAARKVAVTRMERDQIR